MGISGFLLGATTLELNSPCRTAKYNGTGQSGPGDFPFHRPARAATTGIHFAKILACGTTMLVKKLPEQWLDHLRESGSEPPRTGL